MDFPWRLPHPPCLVALLDVGPELHTTAVPACLTLPANISLPSLIALSCASTSFTSCAKASISSSVYCLPPSPDLQNWFLASLPYLFHQALVPHIPLYRTSFYWDALLDSHSGTAVGLPVSFLYRRYFCIPTGALHLASHSWSSP